MNINKTASEQYKAILEQMRDTKNATVRDLLNAEKFFTLTSSEIPANFIIEHHAIGRLFGQLNYTPEHQQFASIIEGALSEPWYGDWVGNKAGMLRKQRQEAEEAFKEDFPTITQPSARDYAIYTAMGVYLRNKLCWLNAHVSEMPASDYEASKAFIETYADPSTDDKTIKHVMHDRELYALPYNALILSDKEMRAIIGVATGLLEPDQTPYPKRMEAVKEALVEADLVHDMKERFSEAIENSGQVRKDGTPGRPFDPEQFKAARERRGADESPQR